MDPQAVLREMLYQLANGERGDAYAACKELYLWLGKGGFLPEVTELDVEGKVAFSV